MRIPYFIINSGEETGVGHRDYGIKFTSPELNPKDIAEKISDLNNFYAPHKGDSYRFFIDLYFKAKRLVEESKQGDNELLFIAPWGGDSSLVALLFNNLDHVGRNSHALSGFIVHNSFLNTSEKFSEFIGLLLSYSRIDVFAKFAKEKPERPLRFSVDKSENSDSLLSITPEFEDKNNRFAISIVKNGRGKRFSALLKPHLNSLLSRRNIFVIDIHGNVLFEKEYKKSMHVKNEISHNSDSAQTRKESMQKNSIEPISESFFAGLFSKFLLFALIFTAGFLTKSFFTPKPPPPKIPSIEEQELAKQAIVNDYLMREMPNRITFSNQEHPVDVIGSLLKIVSRFKITEKSKLSNSDWLTIRYNYFYAGNQEHGQIEIPARIDFSDKIAELLADDVTKSVKDLDLTKPRQKPGAIVTEDISFPARFTNGSLMCIQFLRNDNDGKVALTWNPEEKQKVYFYCFSDIDQLNKSELKKTFRKRLNSEKD